MPRKSSASVTYPIKMTPHQREALIRCTSVSGKLLKKLRQAGDGTQVIHFTREEVNDLNDEAGKSNYLLSHDRNRLKAVQSKTDAIISDEFALSLGISVSKPHKHIPKTDRIFQFKITLQGVKPTIWRQIQVPDCTLIAFHEYIQAAFGWENCHLHEFEVDGVTYSQPYPDGDDFGAEFVDATDVVLSKLLPKSKRTARWIYKYDFGDCWPHEVVFEDSPPDDPQANYPRCVDGKRACPPEDCGGYPGYADYLQVIADPRHERYQDMLQWRGPFDPEAFDLKKTTKQIKNVKP